MDENPSDVLISVVIPVKNGATWIKDCVLGIMGQTLYSQSEIVVIDSGSTDNTIHILQNLPVRLITISPEEFNHGLTRNLGVNLSTGKYVVLTVQDAIPVDNLWLEKLLNGFLDASVAGVCGRQIVPHFLHYNPVDWYRPSSLPEMKKYQFSSPDLFNALTPIEKKKVCSWDNVTAMYKRDVLLKIPFEETVFAEDIIWAKSAFLKGYSLVYNPEAQVAHYHFEDEDYIVKRTFTTWYFRYKHLGYIPQGTTSKARILISMFKTILLTKGLGFKNKLYWIKYNLKRFKIHNSVLTTFTKTLAKGTNELDALHTKLCGLPPIPLRAERR